MGPIHYKRRRRIDHHWKNILLFFSWKYYYYYNIRIVAIVENNMLILRYIRRMPGILPLFLLSNPRHSGYLACAGIHKKAYITALYIIIEYINE